MCTSTTTSNSLSPAPSQGHSFINHTQLVVRQSSAMHIVQLMAIIIFQLVMVSAEISISFDYKKRLMHVTGLTIIVVDNQNYVNMNMSVCFDERVEDRVDSFVRMITARHLLDENFYSALTQYVCDQSESFPQDMTGCDGMPPRAIIGAIKTGHRLLSFVREGHTIESFFLCHLCLHPDALQQMYSIFNYFNTVVQMYSHRKLSSHVGVHVHVTSSVSELELQHQPTIGISLGVNCLSAQLGVALGLRATRAEGYKTGPFDLMTSNYEGMIRCLRDDFLYFTDPKYLELVEVTSDLHLLYNKGGQYIRNTYYNFVFTHESPGMLGAGAQTQAQGQTGEDKEEGYMYVENDFQLLQERYSRRIRDFRDYLASGNHVLFLLTTLSGELSVSRPATSSSSSSKSSTSTAAAAGDTDTDAGVEASSLLFWALEEVLAEKHPGLEYSIQWFLHPERGDHDLLVMW